MDFAHHSYYSSVARLNAEFADWVQQQVRKDKAVCLKQGIKDYTHKLERLEKETGVSVGESGGDDEYDEGFAIPGVVRLEWKEMKGD